MFDTGQSPIIDRGLSLWLDARSRVAYLHGSKERLGRQQVDVVVLALEAVDPSRQVVALDARLVGELVVQARVGDCFTDRLVVRQHSKEHLHHGRDDGRTAAATDHHVELIVLQDHGRRHGRQWPVVNQRVSERVSE